MAIEVVAAAAFERPAAELAHAQARLEDRLLEVVHREGVAGQDDVDPAVADEPGEGPVAPGVDDRGAGHEDDLLPGLPRPPHLVRRPADGDALVDLGRDVVRHEAEDRGLAAPFRGPHPDAAAAQGHRLALADEALLDATGRAVAQHEGAVHPLVGGLRPLAADAHEGVEVGRGVELVGQDAVGLGGAELSVDGGGHRSEVAEALEDGVEGLRVLGFDRDLGGRGVVVGLADPEVQHLELAPLFDHTVEDPPQDVGIDEMPFELDRFLDHRRLLVVGV